MTGIQDWVGKRVGLRCEKDPGDIGHFQAHLEGVDENGVIVAYESKGDLQTRFYPWGRVWHVHLIREDEATNKKPAGFSRREAD